MMQLHWNLCGDGKLWCPFATLDLSTVHAEGVYVIWHGGSSAHVVYIGQGNVAQRIAEHRQDASILQYASEGDLYVTWADVPEDLRGGVERYLADVYNPWVGDRHPNAIPIAVNSPWQ